MTMEEKLRAMRDKPQCNAQCEIQKQQRGNAIAITPKMIAQPISAVRRQASNKQAKKPPNSASKPIPDWGLLCAIMLPPTAANQRIDVVDASDSTSPRTNS